MNAMMFTIDGTPTRTMTQALLRVRTALPPASNDRAALDHLRAQLRYMCAVARQDRVTPERMLIQLKQVIAEASPTDFEAIDQQADLRSRLISFAITAYFSDVE